MYAQWISLFYIGVNHWPYATSFTWASNGCMAVSFLFDFPFTPTTSIHHHSYLTHIDPTSSCMFLTKRTLLCFQKKPAKPAVVTLTVSKLLSIKGMPPWFTLPGVDVPSPLLLLDAWVSQNHVTLNGAWFKPEVCQLAQRSGFFVTSDFRYGTWWSASSWQQVGLERFYLHGWKCEESRGSRYV